MRVHLPLVFALLGPAVVAGCSPQLTATIESDVPIEGQVDIAQTQPMRNDVRIDQPVPVQGSVSLAGPIQLTVPGLTASSSGTFITEDLFNMVKPAITSGEWVQAVFGEPDARATLSDGTEIWRWTFRPADSIVPLFKVFGGKDDKPQPLPLTTCIQVQDGKVIAKWRG